MCALSVSSLLGAPGVAQVVTQLLLAVGASTWLSPEPWLSYEPFFGSLCVLWLSPYHG